MGSAASVDSKPRCPYHRLCEAKKRKAKKTRYINGEASEFYFHCSKGDIDQVRQFLEVPDRLSIDELVKLERNGDTALHAATEKGHTEVVKLLLDHRCSRTILNRSGKIAAEVANTPDLQKLFIRPVASGRFHDSDTTKTMAHYLPMGNRTDKTSNETNATSNETNATSNETDATSNETDATSNGTKVTRKILEFVQPIGSEEEAYEHSLNHQTMAMWLKFYNWFSGTFPSFFQRDNLNLDSFKLHKNNDFKYFLQEKLGEKYQETLEEFDKAQQKNSIEALLTIYSSERYGFYRSLNRQLADSPTEADNSPHLCDRFIIEFHIRDNELEKRSFTGIAFRGATISLSELSLYEKVCEMEPRGILAFKAFTSTSEDKDVALDFIISNPPENDQTGVLFIIETRIQSPTIIGISDVSDFKLEKEILFLPGNLFGVKKVVKNVNTYTKDQKKSIILAEVYLEYIHKPVSFWTKLSHTVQSARKNSVMD